MTGPVTAWRTALRTAAACLIATAAIVGCSSDEPPPDPGLTFSRDAYCDAMHTSARDIDADGLAQGDARALENAGNTYIRLARLAPDRLEDAWATLIADLDSLIAEANGAQSVSPERFAAFRTAYTTIYEDYLTFCTPD